MKTRKQFSLLLLLFVALQLHGFAQIKIVDNDYQPNLGGLEEIKLEDLASELDFDFAVGDSVYVLKSTHKFLCLNKNTHKASIKPFKTGEYVITGICFGDSLDRLHSMVDKYTFDTEDGKQEAHAIIYGFRIKCYDHSHDHRFVGKGYYFRSDTINFDRRTYHLQKLASFYQSAEGERFVQEMMDDIAKLKSGKIKDEDHGYNSDLGSTIFTVRTIVYRFENEEGDMFYIDRREIEVEKLEGDRDCFYQSYHSIKGNVIHVVKSAYYSKIAKDFLGKDFYIYNADNHSWEAIDKMKTIDYLTQKEININLVGGEKFELIFFDLVNDREGDCIYEDYNYNSVQAFGLDHYYRCKDVFMWNDELSSCNDTPYGRPMAYEYGFKFVIVLGNELGEFSALLKKVDGFYGFSYKHEAYGYEKDLLLVPKTYVDSKLQEWKMYEIEKGAKRKKAEQERIAKQKKHNADIIAKYGEKFGKMILQHKVAIGMTREMCREAGWYPRDTYRTTTSSGVSEVWAINYKTALFFSNGVLYMIEN